MANGGKRPGAGRKKGQVNKVSAAARAVAAATGLLPHEFLLTLMRGGEPAQKLLGKGVEVTPDMRITAAEKAAPYYAPRLSAIGLKTAGPDNPWPEILQLVDGKGRKPPSEG